MRRRDRRRGGPLAVSSLIVLLLGSTVTAGVAQAWRAALLEDRQERFVETAEAVTEELNADIRRHADVVSTARSLFVGAERVTRSDFARFAESLELESRYPGLVGVSYVEVVPADALQRFVEARRREGSPEFGVASDRPGSSDLYVVTYIQPEARNRDALGLDLAAHPAVRQALEEARDTAQPALVSSQALEQSGPGFTLYLPVYAVGAPAETTQARRSALRGWVGGTLAPQELVDSIPDPRSAVDVWLYDGRPSAASLLAFSGASPRPPGAASTVTVATQIYGRDWSLRFAARSGFGTALEGVGPALVLFGGLLATVALAVLLWTLARSKAPRPSDATMARLRAGEDFRTAFVEAPIGMCLLDPSGRFIKANRALCELLGRSEEELASTDIGDITHPDDVGADLSRMRRALDGEGPRFRLEQRFLHADGHAVSTRLTGTLVTDGAGRPRCFVCHVREEGSASVPEAAGPATRVDHSGS